VREVPGSSITYTFRDPVFGGPMAGFKHVAALFGETRGELVAFACDDDVWSPGHIATAVESLDRHPEAAAHFSAFYAAESELAHDAYQWGAPLLWLAAGRPERFSEYVLGEAQMLALGWVFNHSIGARSLRGPNMRSQSRQHARDVAPVLR